MLLLGLGCCNGIETKYLYVGRAPSIRPFDVAVASEWRS